MQKFGDTIESQENSIYQELHSLAISREKLEKINEQISQEYKELTHQTREVIEGKDSILAQLNIYKKKDIY